MGGGGYKLKFVKSAVNSGGPSIPRNRGLEISRGKYVFFMDNDDLLPKDGLKELFKLAENFKAEVIYCDRIGTFQDVNKVAIEERPDFVKSPTLIPEDLPTRIQLLQYRFRPEPWVKFCLRDFLIENEIKFGTFISEDSIWTIQLVISAKKFLLIPNVCYLHRDHSESLSKLTHSKPSADNSHKFARKINRAVFAVKMVDNFVDKMKFFQTHPEWRYALLSQVLNGDLSWSLPDVFNLPPHIIYELCKNSYQKDFGEYDVLFSTLITNNVTFMKNLILAQQNNK